MTYSPRGAIQADAAVGVGHAEEDLAGLREQPIQRQHQRRVGEPHPHVARVAREEEQVDVALREGEQRLAWPRARLALSFRRPPLYFVQKQKWTVAEQHSSYSRLNKVIDFFFK